RDRRSHRRALLPRHRSGGAPADLRGARPARSRSGGDHDAGRTARVGGAAPPDRRAAPAGGAGREGIPLGIGAMNALDPLELGLLAGGFLLLVGVAFAAFVRRRRRVGRSVAGPELLRRLVGAGLQEIPWRRLGPAAVAACALALARVAA